MSMASILGLTSGNSSNNMCYLQWWRRRGGWLDGNEGLLHQLSSLGVALAEAHYLRRTMVLPTEEFCLPGKHTQHVAGQTIATTFNSSATCFDYDELFDLELLSKFVRVVRPSQLPKLDDSSIAQVIGTAKSEEMHARYPCGARHAVLCGARPTASGSCVHGREWLYTSSSLLHSMGALESTRQQQIVTGSRSFCAVDSSMRHESKRRPERLPRSWEVHIWRSICVAATGSRQECCAWYCAD